MYTLVLNNLKRIQNNEPNTLRIPAIIFPFAPPAADFGGPLPPAGPERSSAGSLGAGLVPGQEPCFLAGAASASFRRRADVENCGDRHIIPYTFEGNSESR